MTRLAQITFTSLGLAFLLSACGVDGQVVADRAPTAERTAGPLPADRALPNWHPALPAGHPPVAGMAPALPEGHPLLLPEGHPSVLPEGHPPLTSDECPAGGSGGGFDDTFIVPAGTGGTIST